MVLGLELEMESAMDLVAVIPEAAPMESLVRVFR